MRVSSLRRQLERKIGKKLKADEEDGDEDEDQSEEDDKGNGYYKYLCKQDGA